MLKKNRVIFCRSFLAKPLNHLSGILLWIADSEGSSHFLFELIETHHPAVFGVVVFVSDRISSFVDSLILRSFDVSGKVRVDPLSGSFLHQRCSVRHLLILCDVAPHEHELEMERSEPIFDLVRVSIKEIRLAWLHIFFHLQWSIIFESGSR